MIKTIQSLTRLHKQLFCSFLASASFSFIPRSVQTATKYDQLYDLAVIGGGSGGLSTAF